MGKDYAEIEIDGESRLIINNRKYVFISKAAPIKNLVLSGGGAKGTVYLGAVKALENHRITGEQSARDQIEHVAASSIGAVVGALFAVGMPSDDLIQATEKLDFKKLLGKGIGAGSLQVHRSGKPLTDFLEQKIKESIKKILLKKSLEEIEQCKKLDKEEIERIKELYESLKSAQPVSITFSLLRSLSKLDENRFKQLTVTATCKEKGELFIFDADKTPDLDIVTACRASASLPIILEPVKIAGWLVGHPEKDFLSFVDGGLIDNVPVAAVDQKQTKIKGFNEGEQKQNLQTLAFVFDENTHPTHPQSFFHEHDASSSRPLYTPGLKDKLTRNFAVNTFVVKTPESPTAHKAKTLKTIQSDYTQRNVPLNVAGVKTTDFKKAKEKSAELIETGRKQTEDYLRNHDQEAVYISADSAEKLLAEIPRDKLDKLQPVDGAITRELIEKEKRTRIAAEHSEFSSTMIMHQLKDRTHPEVSPPKISTDKTAPLGEKKIFQPLKPEEKRATIGIRCTDLETGSEFYRAVQELMAQLYPREYDRPKIYLDLGGKDENSSSLLGTHREKLDVILIPQKKTKQDKEAAPNFTAENLVKAIYPTSAPSLRVAQNGADLFAKFNVNVSNQNKLGNKPGIRPLKDTVVGIVGGMGPEADGYTLERLTKEAAKKGKEASTRVYLMSDPRVPRDWKQKTAAVKLQAYKRRLQEFLKIPELETVIVPSNTFHTGLQYSWAQNQSGGKILSIIDSVANEAKEKFQKKTIGLLATSTTAKSGIYRDRLIKAGANVVQPNDELQEKVDLGIHAMKSGNIKKARDYFEEVIHDLKKQGAEVILLGCTEIPLALENHTLPSGLEYVDSADILGRAAVKQSEQLLKSKNTDFISAVYAALFEYSKKNSNPTSDGAERANRLFHALQAAPKSREDYQKLVTMINQITSGSDYYWFHRRRTDGLDSILERHLKLKGDDDEGEGRARTNTVHR